VVVDRSDFHNLMFGYCSAKSVFSRVKACVRATGSYRWVGRPAFQMRYLTAHVERCDVQHKALIREDLGVWGTGMRFPLGQEQTGSNSIIACRDSKDILSARASLLIPYT
jgi:hypothetical protein